MLSVLAFLGCGSGREVEPVFNRPPAIQFADDVVAVTPPPTFSATAREGSYALGLHTASRDHLSTIALLVRPAPPPDAEAFVLAIDVPTHRAMARALPTVAASSTEVVAIDLPVFLGLPYEELELDVFVWDRNGITPALRTAVPLNRTREGRLPLGVTGATWFRDPVEDASVTAASLLHAEAGQAPATVVGRLFVDQAAHEAPLLVLVVSGTRFAWGRNPLPAGARGVLPFDLDVRDLFRNDPPEGPARVIVRHGASQTPAVSVRFPTAAELAAAP